jgi:hypothetical protein
MVNFHSLFDRRDTAGLSWGSMVMLLRASAMAAFLVIVVGTYTRPPRDTTPAVETSQASAMAPTVPAEMAVCEQRYAEWALSHPNEGPAALRAELAAADCIESEP